MLILLRAMLPLAIWFASFSILYGVATLACGAKLWVEIERHLMLTLAAVIVGLLVTASLRTEANAFFTTLFRGLSGLAILAALWLLLPLLILRSC